MSSKTITNERPVCDSRSMLVETRGRGGGVSEAVAGQLHGLEARDGLRLAVFGDREVALA